MAKDKQTCFVISPIGSEGSDTRRRADQILKHVIVPAVTACDFEALRADQISEPGLITTQVIQHIIEDPLVIADLTDSNPNVFYEAGIAHTLGKHVVPITQNPDDIPFDLRHHRYASYLNNNEGREALEKDLKTRFQTLSNKRKRLLWS